MAVWCVRYMPPGAWEAVLLQVQGQPGLHRSIGTAWLYSKTEQQQQPTSLAAIWMQTWPLPEPVMKSFHFLFLSHCSRAHRPE